MNGLKKLPMKKMRRPFSFVVSRLSLLFCILSLAACMPSGLADVSANGQKFAIVNSNDLYVYSTDSEEVAFYNFFSDTRYSPALSADGSGLAFVDRGGRLIYQPLNGDKPRQLLPQSINQPGPGALSFLPDGTLLFVNSGNVGNDLRIFDVTTGQTLTWQQGISHIFVSATVLESREAPTALNQNGVGHVNASKLDHFNLVLLPITCSPDLENQACFYSFTADTSGFHFNGQLGRSYTTDTQIFFSRRISDDLTSGVLTPDGTHLVLRVRSIANPNESQSVYLFDLNTNDPPVTLVENGEGRPDYSISPDGQFIAYEEMINGVDFVRLYNVATGDRTDLGPGSLDPQWWQ